MEQLGLRERTRRAVRAELIEVAQRLFVENGFEETTVDQIAARASMSQRSFFRYFPNKDALVLGKYDALADSLEERLASRPLDEAAWTSLRATFEYFVEYIHSPGAEEKMRELERVIEQSPTLRSGYLERIDRMQARLTEILRSRAADARNPWPEGHPGPRALVTAAFGCAIAAREASVTRGVEYATALDQAMDSIASLSHLAQ